MVEGGRGRGVTGAGGKWRSEGEGGGPDAGGGEQKCQKCQKANMKEQH